MKLTSSEWHTLSRILENRSYRYADSDDTSSKAYKTFNSIDERVRTSAEGSTQRYTAEQKKYMIDMLEEYQEYNSEYASDSAEEADIIAMLYKLTGKKPLDMCDLMCR